MNCERCAALWPDVIAGTLPPDLAAAARRHADGCAECRRDGAAWLALAAAARERVSMAAAAPPPPAVALAKIAGHGADRTADRAAQGIAGPTSPTGGPARPHAQPRRPSGRTAVGIAAALALAALGGWFGPSAWRGPDARSHRDSSTAPGQGGQRLASSDARRTEAAADPGWRRASNASSSPLPAAPPPTIVSRRPTSRHADVRLVAGPTAARWRPNDDTAGVALATAPAPAFAAIPPGGATPSRGASRADPPSQPRDRVDPPTPTQVSRPPDRGPGRRPPLRTPPAGPPLPPPPTALATTPPTALAPALLVLLGQVRTADGRPVPEARVFIVPWPDDGRFQVAGTASDGTFDASVVPGRYRVRVVADGFSERWYGDDDGAGPRTIDVEADSPVPSIFIVLPAAEPPVTSTATPTAAVSES